MKYAKDKPLEDRDRGATHIRWMICRDMEEVLEIEQLCFADPWDGDDFMRTFRQRNCIGMVVDDGRDVLAFMVYELHKSRIQLLGLAVHPSCWRGGLGRLMIEKLKRKLAPYGRREIRTAVQETNLAGQLFFRAMGFRAESIMPDCFKNSELKGVTGYQFSFQVGEVVESE